MRTVIVGGGLGGLAAAVMVAERGGRVTVLERAREAGGRARSEDVVGAKLNFGPHAVYRGGHAERIVTKLVGMPKGAAPRTRGYALLGDTMHTLPAGPISLLSTGLFDFGGRIEAARVFATIGRAKAAGDESVGSFLAREIGDATVRATIAMFMRIATYTHPVEELRAKDALAQLAMAVGPGVTYLDGGWQTLVDRMRARAEALGVVIRTGAKVTKVAVERGRARWIEVDDGHVEALDGLVLAVGPKVAARLLPADAAFVEATKALRAVEAACLDVVTGPLVTPATALFGVDAPHYGVVHSASAALAPAGMNVVHLAKYLDGGEDATKAELFAILERMQPGIVVHHARYLPKITVMNARPTAATGGLDGRIAATSYENVALVGDWVGKRGMLLDAVLASAEEAAERIAESAATAYPSASSSPLELAAIA